MCERVILVSKRFEKPPGTAPGPLAHALGMLGPREDRGDDDLEDRDRMGVPKCGRRKRIPPSASYRITKAAILENTSKSPSLVIRGTSLSRQHWAIRVSGRFAFRPWRRANALSRPERAQYPSVSGSTGISIRISTRSEGIFGSLNTSLTVTGARIPV